MTHSSREAGSYHVLLVGIDDYAKKPLSGCVNDIDAVQQILLERAKVPKERILRLASPRKQAAHSTEIPAQPATLANLRAGFAELAQRAKEGDRVFIYYSGHGARVEFARQDGHTFHREALVPIDFDVWPTETLLYDHELDQLLGDITARTRSVTFVLDCCHSAGGMRDPGLQLTSRFLDTHADLGLSEPVRDRETGEPRGDGVVRTIDDCQVIAACLHHELAWEGSGDDGRTHGLLTRAFTRSLEPIPDAELSSVPWSRIWQPMRGNVELQNPHQHLWMAGNAGRSVLAGQPNDDDGTPGFSVRRNDDAYEIVPSGVPSRLRCAIVPAHQEVIEAVAASPLLEVVEPDHAQVRLEQAGDHWAITDDLHGIRPGYELCTLAAHQLDRARDVLEHYFYYAQPLRMAESAIDLPGALQLTVLNCRNDLSPIEADVADLTEARMTEGTSVYDVSEGAGICFRVANKSKKPLRVTLVNSAASGRVQILDEPSIDAGCTHTFWAGNKIGRPFQMKIPDGRLQAIDRLIAIGTTTNQDVAHLRVVLGFVKLLTTTHASRDIGGGQEMPASLEPWTAAQVIVKTHARLR